MSNIINNTHLAQKVKKFPNRVLPRQLIDVGDSLVMEMNDLTGWTKVAGSTMTIDSSNPHSGGASITLLSNSGETAQMQKTVNWDLKRDDTISLKFWVRANTDVSTTLGGSLTVYLYKDGTTSDYKYKTFTINTSTMQNGVWTMVWGKNIMGGTGFGDWTTGAGNLDFSHIGRIKFAFTVKSGQQASISFGQISWGVVRHKACIISFDDGWQNQYNMAFPLFKERNMVASIFPHTDSIGATGRLTSAMLQEMYAYGFDICNHSKSHADFRTLNEAQVRYELDSAKTVLLNYGFSRSADLVAYPFGYYTDNVLAAMISGNYRAGRFANGWGYPYMLYESGLYFLGFRYRINSMGLTYDMSIAQAKSYIDGCLQLNTPCGLLLHNIVTSNSLAANEWNVDALRQILDYILEKGMQTLTYNEYMQLEHQNITVNHK